MTDPTGTAPGSMFFAVSSSGALAYLPGVASFGNSRDSNLAIFPRDGPPEPLPLRLGNYRSPRVSTDGRWVAFEIGDEKQWHVAVYEIGARRTVRRLTFEGNSRAPLWSPDGVWVLFASDREGDVAIYRTRADGSGAPERLTKPDKDVSHTPQSWTRDGTQLLFSAGPPPGIQQSRLFLLSMKERTVTAFGDMAARDARFSPDGRWVAYGTRAAGAVSGNRNQVFVEPFPRTGAKYLLPRPSGHPLWSPEGDALLTNATAGVSELTPVVYTPAFDFGESVQVPKRGRNEGDPMVSRTQADMMPDGRVIGVLRQSSAESTTTDIHVVLNWFNELHQRIPIR
ncbi:MAG TPA: hypothetical protein VMM36_14010 [Opitutaceae bacterium]|nr:hypothetical protein [Opitutaceae bacterium]